MKVVVIQLKSIGEQFVELRYRVPGAVEYQSRNLPSTEIAGLYDFIDRDFESDNYYLPKLGRKLFDWLDGSQRWLSGSIDLHRRGLIIAIDVQGRLGGLPWEILFDDKGFLVTRSIVPIRVVGGFAVGERLNTVPDRELRALFMATDPLGVYPKLNLELNGDGAQVLKAAVVQPLMALLDGMSLSNLPHRVMITCRYTVQLERKYQRRIQQFQVERMDGADEEKLFDRLESFSPRSGVDPDVRSKARKIADGYPRLLEWLDRVLAAPNIDPGAILTAMKDKQAEFLENILAEKLLEQQHRGLRVMLERGTLFDVPVPLDILKSICGEFDRTELDRHVVRSTALGLLESGLTDGLVRVPKVLNLTLKQKDKQKLAELAVRALYDVWIEKAPTSTEEQQVEIHRLAMLGGDGEIAVEMAQRLSNSWIAVSRYRAARTLCEETLALQKDSTVIYNLSRIYESLGELNQALTLCEQSIEIYRAIGNRQGEAASLHQMSMIYESLGELNQALTLCEQSLEIYRAIGDRQGEAASLAQMAAIAYQQGNPVRERELYLQAATIRGSICDYGGLVTTLRNLGMDDEPDALGYFAQSLWLTLRLSTNLDDAISLIQAIFNKIPSGDPLEALLGATAVHFCATRSHPKIIQLAEQSRKMLADAASQQGIDTPEEREKWFVANRLGDADDVLAATSELLESIVGDGWLFDRSGL